MSKPHCHDVYTPTCRICWLAKHDPRYQQLWGLLPSPSDAETTTAKPRINIGELAAKRRRCGELNQAGKPCNEFVPIPQQGVLTVRPPLTWAVGLTTVPERRADLLPQTLESLKRAGFASIRLFMDGADTLEHIEHVKRWGLDHSVVSRFPRIGAFGNWALGLWELLIRHPSADRFAMFQDDAVFCLGLREYLERSPWPKNGYLNCYEWLSNFKQNHDKGDGWHLSNQKGRGAVALIFDREAVLTLLSSRVFVSKPVEAVKADRTIDGCIADAMHAAGFQEWVHHPSLCFHVGEKSAIGNPVHLPAPDWRGEDWDCRNLLKS